MGKPALVSIRLNLQLERYCIEHTDSCIWAFVQSLFVKRYDLTIEDPYRRQVQIDDQGPCILEILDTARNEQQLTAMRVLFIKSSHDFLLFHSISSMASYLALHDS